MTLIIISGEIDVSVGPMVAFVSVCLAFLLQFEVPLAIACLLVLLLGALMGTLAGVLRGVFNVPSFVATLGLWSALRGMGLFMTNALPVPIDENEVLDWLGGQFLGVPVSALIMIVLFALFVFISRKTAFGRSVFAVGGNATAAQLCGGVRRSRCGCGASECRAASRRWRVCSSRARRSAGKTSSIGKEIMVAPEQSDEYNGEQ